jgi:hypothetical protein
MRDLSPTMPSTSPVFIIEETNFFNAMGQPEKLATKELSNPLGADERELSTAE